MFLVQQWASCRSIRKENPSLLDAYIYIYVVHIYMGTVKTYDFILNIDNFG